MIGCYRRISFCAGHRIPNHETKCKNLHGHNYTATVYARTINEKLDKLGRVIDFAILKEKIGGWIDNNFDHGMILSSDDGDAIRAISSVTGSKIFMFPYIPTAENIAKYILEEVCPMVLKDSGVEVYKVTLDETENCAAEVTL